jgi:hypothetical protein
MAADGSLLQGEVIEDPKGEEKDVERLLRGFLRALLEEQKIPGEPKPAKGET